MENLNYIFVIQIIITSIGLIYSCYTDVKSRLIKNFITFPMMLIGIILNIINLGFTQGIKTSLIGMGLVFVICILFSMVGGFGFGDTKLLMGIGSMFGGWFSIDVLVFSFLIMIFYFLIFKIRDAKKLFNNIKIMSISALYTQKLPTLDEKETAWKAPYACFISIGFLVSLISLFLTGGNIVWTILN